MYKHLGFLSLLFLLPACGGTTKDPDDSTVDDIPDVEDPLPDVDPDPVTPISQHEEIVQTPIPEADVLFVIDNSCSMAETQYELSMQLEAFVKPFIDSTSDWHFGVVTTDMQNFTEAGKLQSFYGERWVSPTVPNPLDRLQGSLAQGTMGASTEAGRAAIEAALTTHLNGTNSGFYRTAASLTTIVISDENDYSGENPSLSDFKIWFDSLKSSDPELSHFSALVSPTGQACPLSVEPGELYADLTSSYDGVLMSLCATDWTAELKEVAYQALHLTDTFVLANAPAIQTIIVWVEERVLTPNGSGGYDESFVTLSFTEGVDFTYNPADNSIEFIDYTPAPLSIIHIEYDEN